MKHGETVGGVGGQGGGQGVAWVCCFSASLAWTGWLCSCCWGSGKTERRRSWERLFGWAAQHGRRGREGKGGEGYNGLRGCGLLGSGAGEGWQGKGAMDWLWKDLKAALREGSHNFPAVPARRRHVQGRQTNNERTAVFTAPAVALGPLVLARRHRWHPSSPPAGDTLEGSAHDDFDSSEEQDAPDGSAESRTGYGKVREPAPYFTDRRAGTAKVRAWALVRRDWCVTNAEPGSGSATVGFRSTGGHAETGARRRCSTTRSPTHLQLHRSPDRATALYWYACIPSSRITCKLLVRNLRPIHRATAPGWWTCGIGAPPPQQRVRARLADTHSHTLPAHLIHGKTTPLLQPGHRATAPGWWTCGSSLRCWCRATCGWTSATSTAPRARTSRRCGPPARRAFCRRSRSARGGTLGTSPRRWALGREFGVRKTDASLKGGSRSAAWCAVVRVGRIQVSGRETSASLPKRWAGLSSQHFLRLWCKWQEGRVVRRWGNCSEVGRGLGCGTDIGLYRVHQA